jgi:regulator of G-protein signaling
VFRDFLRCEYSEENILFWLACEELKKETNPDVVEEKARFIYEDYISILSPKEVIIKTIFFIISYSYVSLIHS